MIFTRKQTRSQRTPNGGAVVVIFVKAGVFPFHAFAFEHVVLRLFDDRLVQVVAFRNFNGLRDLRRRPFGCAPVQGFAPFNDVVHSPDGFFNGRGCIGAVTVDQVHVIELQTFERAIDAFNETLTIQRVPFIDTIVQTPKEFCGNQITSATPLQLLERITHHLFGFAARVYFSVIEKVHARIIRGSHHILRQFHIRLIMESNPRAKRQLAYSNASLA